MIGPIRGMNLWSYQSRPFRSSPMRRVRKPAASGIPRKIRTVLATCQIDLEAFGVEAEPAREDGQIEVAEEARTRRPGRAR